MIALPGFVDTHWHLWNSTLRGLIDYLRPEQSYFPLTMRLGPLCTPSDAYINVKMAVPLAPSEEDRPQEMGSFCQNRNLSRTNRHLADLERWGLRRRTPGPPPFSSMNSTPADSNARLIASSVALIGLRFHPVRALIKRPALIAWLRGIARPRNRHPAYFQADLRPQGVLPRWHKLGPQSE